MKDYFTKFPFCVATYMAILFLVLLVVNHKYVFGH